VVRPRRRALVFGLALIAATSLAEPAAGAVFIRLSTLKVHRGGVLRLVGDADHMPLYALPASLMPCARYGTCSDPIHRTKQPRRKPFTFLGYTPSNAGMTARAFTLRLPRALKAGRYKIFVWCSRCGGSLIVAGADSSGQTLHVLR
jgi:hypothetical protein